MKRLIFGAALLFVALFVFLALHDQATAQPKQSAPLEVVEQRLAEIYAEMPVWTGIAGAQRVVIYGDAEYSTFTIVTIDGLGRACLVAAGQAWFALVIDEPTVGEEG